MSTVCYIPINRIYYPSNQLIGIILSNQVTWHTMDSSRSGVGELVKTISWLNAEGVKDWVAKPGKD